LRSYHNDKEKFSYVYSSGIVYLTLDINGRLRESNRLAYHKQAKWFMQSGHGLGGKRAGIDLGNSSDRESIFYINGITDGKMRTDTVKNILKEKWYNVRALILNSCYNLNLNLTTGKYPTKEEIWDEDLSKEYIDYVDGRWNNGLKWVDILKERPGDFVILGWGQCIVDGKWYGRGDRIEEAGQSPSDIVNGISVTENIMDKFLKKMTTDNTLYIAEKWVEAVAEIIRDHYLTNKNKNVMNAVAIARVGNMIHVWALDKDVKPSNSVWSFTY
jgi:hypothetical protein